MTREVWPGAFFRFTRMSDLREGKVHTFTINGDAERAAVVRGEREIVITAVQNSLEYKMLTEAGMTGKVILIEGDPLLRWLVVHVSNDVRSADSITSTFVLRVIPGATGEDLPSPVA